MSSLHLLNQYSNNNGSSQKDKRSKRLNNHKANPKSTLDRPLPPGNVNINYNTFEVRIPNYIFGKAVELAGAGGLIGVCIGKRYILA
jgi:hypothetical protein